MKPKYFLVVVAFITAGLLATINQEPPAQNLPDAISYEQTAQPVATGIQIEQLPDEVNLAVPFTSQAPHKIWDEEHNEFCEEASVLMAAHYIQGLLIANADYAEEQLQKIKNWEIITLGFHKDTTAQETSRILTEYFDIENVKLLRDPDLDQIRKFLAEGKLIVTPAAGRLLGNPNFHSPGPLYHMLVIKGYTQDGKLITNDPGTRKGADYIYDPEVIMNAMHDWNDGDVYNGQKIVIIIG
ncbi:MAG: hypothetical protein A3E98_03505 [Candidatus Doudnabacteria bacterium RIFCSPHIGHO2_12_FULL_48_11]|uniref:Peptidase C39-like domain-containing protein n=1 Tax=Candidatus Doudnabacteria bacterium RIFCSPHIGHO2_01_FULL_46_24 TaxID=1817825 RepID=A0A1F5NT42_9BACT|nr:MAG: hypothetical protein A2720_04455 [Candidatus Doudnabacteria bacterium RIFCSPHIGHO2_01_FULL_46_24]OGE96147.1 MAG: hypothetical protein A3E98_03505 [Candidatus Doudnabacteria bacterium RIFCSPHIGHO2_12_FULL_48_11]